MIQMFHHDVLAALCHRPFFNNIASYCKSCTYLLEPPVDFLKHSMCLEPLQSISSAGVHSLNPWHDERITRKVNNMGKAYHTVKHVIKNERRLIWQNPLIIEIDIYSELLEYLHVHISVWSPLSVSEHVCGETRGKAPLLIILTSEFGIIKTMALTR